MERGSLLNVEVRKSTAVLELFAGEDKTLLIWKNIAQKMSIQSKDKRRMNVPFLILGLPLRKLTMSMVSDDLTSRVTALPVSVLTKILHSTAEVEHQVECGLLLDVAVGKSTVILEPYAGEDKKLIWGNTAQRTSIQS